jgi:FkbM family methyltransferase
MIKNIFKRGVKHFLNHYGYDVVSKKQFGNNIHADLETLLKPNASSLLFDIGANLGQTAIEFSDQYPQSKIYSFEPDPNTYIKLTDNVRNRPGIQPFNIGFGNRTEMVKMNLNKSSGGNSILDVSENIKEFAHGDWTISIDQCEVEITTLNSFCALHDIKRIDLLKIDTQGYELKVIEGGDRVIVPSFTKAIYVEVLFVELYKGQAYFMDVYKILIERGFRFVGFYNTFRKGDLPSFLLWCDALFVSEQI